MDLECSETNPDDYIFKFKQFTDANFVKPKCVSSRHNDESNYKFIIHSKYLNSIQVNVDNESMTSTGTGASKTYDIRVYQYPQLIGMIKKFELKVEYWQSFNQDCLGAVEVILKTTPNCTLINCMLEYWDIYYVNMFAFCKCRELDFILYHDQKEIFLEDIENVAQNVHLTTLSIRTVGKFGKI